MNFDDSVLTERANASLPARASDDSKFGEIFGQWIGTSGISEKLLALAGFVDHRGEAIFEERNLSKIIHRFHELSPVSPQIYQQPL